MRSERSKVHSFSDKRCGCAHGDHGDPFSSTIEIEGIVDCRNNNINK